MPLIDDLRAAKNYYMLAAIFGVSAQRLASLLYSSGGVSGYRVFEIPKKSGSYRIIESPVGTRRRVQVSLKGMLDEIYRPPSAAHGFVSKRSVRTNADPHVRKKTVINIDLENFFHSVSFVRVRGMFLSRPFSFNWTVANVLAQALCSGGRLPMGGPCSPVISNFVSVGLDKAFSVLAERNGGDYTRYCDDISLSFDRAPGNLSNIVVQGQDGSWVVSGAVEELINSQGFKLNRDKVRVRSGKSRKTVTGVVVNERPNLSRNWLRDLEKSIYLAEKWGLESAASRYFSEKDPAVAARMLLRKVHGQIAYLSMVRGRGDWFAAELSRRFNLISNIPSLHAPEIEVITQHARLKRGVLVMHCFSGGAFDYLAPDSQGTAFCVERKGLIVTAAHVIYPDGEDYSGSVYVHHEHDPSQRRKCLVLDRCLHRDVAVLKLEDDDSSMTRCRFSLGPLPATNDSLLSVGYPDYSYGNSHQRQLHDVTALPVASAVQKIRVTGDVRGGLSGSPVMDQSNRVVGLVHRGVLMGGHANELIASSVISGMVSSL